MINSTWLWKRTFPVLGVVTVLGGLTAFSAFANTTSVISTPDVPSPGMPGWTDDPDAYDVDTSVEYRPVVSEPQWVVPAMGGAAPLPREIKIAPSNNNTAIEFHDGRMFMAWRSAPTHFASKKSRILVVSSPDMGKHWEFETEIKLGTDVREPNLISYDGRLILYFFEAGNNPFSFSPKHMWRVERMWQENWTDPVKAGIDGEVNWDMKVRKGRVWMTSYHGNHYKVGESSVEVFLKWSTDGVHFEPAHRESGIVYRGGVSEVGFEFDEKGGLWGVGRNEDGDRSGFGAMVFHALSDRLWKWNHAKESDPRRYDSPKMFRHGKDLYLLARREKGPAMNVPGGIELFKWIYLGQYSLRPKTSALYKIDREKGKVVHVMDLPGKGDTALFSVRRTGPHSFLIANYTSPINVFYPNWISGQLSPRGSHVYLQEIRFQ